jgi:PIN domain nuclease of toxin-antitoxin system
MEPGKWFRKSIEQHQLDVLPLSPEILMAANRLPWHHKDPVDRFIIASAISQKAVVVSTDQVFARYDIHLIS